MAPQRAVRADQEAEEVVLLARPGSAISGCGHRGGHVRSLGVVEVPLEVRPPAGRTRLGPDYHPPHSRHSSTDCRHLGPRSRRGPQWWSRSRERCPRRRGSPRLRNGDPTCHPPGRPGPAWDTGRSTLFPSIRPPRSALPGRVPRWKSLTGLGSRPLPRPRRRRLRHMGAREEGRRTYSFRSGGALQRQHRQPQDPLIELADATAVFGRPLQGSAAGPSDQVATMLDELVNRTPPKRQSARALQSTPA